MPNEEDYFEDEEVPHHTGKQRSAMSWAEVLPTLIGKFKQIVRAFHAVPNICTSEWSDYGHATANELSNILERWRIKVGNDNMRARLIDMQQEGMVVFVREVIDPNTGKTVALYRLVRDGEVVEIPFKTNTKTALQTQLAEALKEIKRLQRCNQQLVDSVNEEAWCDRDDAYAKTLALRRKNFRPRPK